MFALKSKRVVQESTQARTGHLVKLIILYSTRSERIEAFAESLKTIRHVGCRVASDDYVFICFYQTHDYVWYIGRFKTLGHKAVKNIISYRESFFFSKNEVLVT